MSPLKLIAMVDSIHIRVPIEDITKEQLEALKQKIIISHKKESLLSGKQLMWGAYKNFKITISEKSVTINGSLTKFFRGGSNGTAAPLTFAEIKAAILQLNAELEIPILKGQIARIDIAENIPLKKNIRYYFMVLLDTPKYERQRRKKNLGIIYLLNTVEMSFYDKANDMTEFLGEHVMRIECRIKSNVRRTLGMPKLRVAHLLFPCTLERLAVEWVKHYDAIFKKRKLLFPGSVQMPKEFNEYAHAKAAFEMGYAEWLELIDLMAKEKGWSARAKKTVKNNASEYVHNEKYSCMTRYAVELDEVVKKTVTYKHGKS